MTAAALFKHGVGRAFNVLSRLMMLTIMATLSHVAVERHLDDLEFFGGPARPGSYSEQSLIKGSSSRPATSVSDSGATVSMTDSGHSNVTLLAGAGASVLADALCHANDICPCDPVLPIVNGSGTCGARDPPRA